MMQVIYSEMFNGWIVCESRLIDQRVVNVPISIPYNTAEEAIAVFHQLLDMWVKLNLL